MKRFLTLLICVGLFSFVLPSSAQVSGAAVSLVCDETHTPADPIGIQNYTFQCTVSNPTAYVENVSIEMPSEYLDTTVPPYLEVGAGQEETFDATVNWTSFSIGDFIQMNITVSVQELNNLPPPNAASSEYNGILDLDYNYTDNDCVTTGTLTPEEFVVFEVGGNLGNITLELNHSASPFTAMNFQLLATMGCYDHTIFHRVIDGFMIQGGDFENGDGTGGHAASWQGYCNGAQTTEAQCPSVSSFSIPDEADNNLTHQPYSLSMAKTSADNTGGSQFFIMDNNTASWLDGQHTVFGKVVVGFGVVDSISETETGQNDRPVNDIIIENVMVLNTINHDHDADGVVNGDDNCPDTPNAQQIDTDGDGTGDVCDDDIDGDGVNNEEDAFPNDNNETADYDGDGTGDNVDADDDNDGMNDTSDAFPYDQNETTDTDGDGIGDNSDADDDGDGVADTTDNCPYVPNADQADADSDGIGTACDSAEEENEAPSVPAIGVVGTLLAVSIAVGSRKFD
jgi:cyclophilin family peptidyl-prolyl cis-trans isomerase